MAGEQTDCRGKLRRLTRSDETAPQQPGGPCRMAGKQAWELGTGTVFQVLANFAATTSKDLTVAVRWMLSHDQRSIAAKDFDIGLAFIVATLQQIFQF